MAAALSQTATNDKKKELHKKEKLREERLAGRNPQMSSQLSCV